MPFSLQNSFLAKRMLISRKLFHRREIGGKWGFFANSPAVTKGLTWFLILLKSKMAAIVGDFTALQQRHHPQIYIILLRRSKAFHWVVQYLTRTPNLSGCLKQYSLLCWGLGLLFVWLSYCFHSQLCEPFSEVPFDLPIKAKSFRNAATYLKPWGGFHHQPPPPLPCNTMGLWICVYVRGLRWSKYSAFCWAL